MPNDLRVEIELNGAAARVKFLAIDRPDLQYASKESSRRKAKPVNKDWEILKRIARYLVSHRWLVHLYEWQDESPPISIYTDSDWAGCVRTRPRVLASSTGGI